MNGAWNAANFVALPEGDAATFTAAHAALLVSFFGVFHNFPRLLPWRSGNPNTSDLVIPMQLRTYRGVVAIDGKEAVGYQRRNRRDLYCDSRARKVKKDKGRFGNLVTACPIRTNSLIRLRGLGSQRTSGPSSPRRSISLDIFWKQPT